MAPEDLDKLASLLAAGTSHALAAAATSCSTSRVSQLLSPSNEEPEAQALRDLLAEHQARELAHKQEVDKHIEDAVLEIAQTLRTLARESVSLGESTRALATLEELQARRKAYAAQGAGGAGGQQGAQFALGVSLGALATTRINIVLGAGGQIMELGGRNMMPMQTAKVLELAAASHSSPSPSPSSARVSITMDMLADDYVAPLSLSRRGDLQGLYECDSLEAEEPL